MMKTSIIVVLALASCVLLADARRSKRAAHLQFHASPKTVYNNVTEELKLECKAPESIRNMQQFFIMFIESTVENASVVASVTAEKTEVVVDDPRVSAEGDSGKAPHLTVTISKPTYEDEGIYTCSFIYLEKKFSVMTLSTYVNITIEEQPTAAAPVVVPTGDCNCDGVWAEINKLKASVLSENQLLRDQVKKYNETCRASFSAYLESKNGVKLLDDQLIIFDSVTSNKGEAYDTKTGEFTAPCSGQYFFTLSLRSNQNMDAGTVYGNIMTDNQVMARTSVFIDTPLMNYQSATNGVVLSLTEGQKVSVNLESTSEGNILGKSYSVFSGFYLFP